MDDAPGPDEIVRRADVLWRRTLDGVLVRRRGDAETVLLAGTGVALWEALADPRPVGALADDLAVAHGADVAVVADDLAAVLAHLLAAGLVARG